MKFKLFPKYVQFIDCLQKEATMYCCPLSRSAVRESVRQVSQFLQCDPRPGASVSGLVRSTRRHFESESLTLHPL